MKSQKNLTRDKIVQTLIRALTPLNYIHAFYEGGAAAFNRIDEWSDIDLYLVVDDDKVEETFFAVESTLQSLSPIKQKYDVPQTPWPGISQAFYRLEDANEFLIIDLAILKLSSPEKFLEPEIHGNVVFHFNKSNRVKPAPLDKNPFLKKINGRLEKIQARFDMFNNFVQKEINRGNYLEAIDLYYGVTLPMLVEILRIKHNPLHYDFKMRYVYYELPQEVVEKLQNLYSVRDQKDLQNKYSEANKWFRRVILEIDKKKIEKLIRSS